MSEVKPIQGIRKIGYQALVQALGPIDAARYMRSCEGGFNDFDNVVSEIIQVRQS